MSSSAKGEAKTILLLARSLNIGGTERQLVQLATGLHARGCRVVVAVFYRGGALDAEIVERGITLVDLGKSGRWDIAGFLRRARAAIASLRPDSVYSFLGTANIVAALLRPVSPRFRLVWSIRAAEVDLRSFGWTSRLNYRAEASLARQADLIISNSVAGRVHAGTKGFPLDRIEVVPNGIDTDRFRPDPAAREAMRRSWGLAGGDIAVGVLARIDPLKDHSTFLRAAAQVAAQRRDVRFFCIGEGEEAYRRQLLGLADQLRIAERVVWTGGSANPAAALNGLDISCLPSAYEGFPNAIGEAMACAVPCVVTDVGDSALIVGDTGSVVPPGRPDALADALLAEIGRLGEGRGTRARARIVENFSVDRMVERTLSLVLPDGPSCGTDRSE